MLLQETIKIHQRNASTRETYISCPKQLNHSFAYPYLITCGYSNFLSNANSLCNSNNKPIISNQKTVSFSLNVFAVCCMNQINLIVFRATFNLIIWDYSGSLSKSNKNFKSRNKIWSSKSSLLSMKTFYESLDKLLKKKSQLIQLYYSPKKAIICIITAGVQGTYINKYIFIWFA